MRKAIYVLVALGFACALSVTSFAKDMKVGYVDVFKVFQDYKKTQDYEKDLDGKKTRQEARLKSKEEDIKKMQEGLDLLKDDQKEKARDRINQDALALDKELREVSADLQKERETKMKELVVDVDKIVAEYAKKNGFDLVMNKTAVLYGDSAMDVTADILSIANQRYVPGASSSSRK
jgi:outer membrane protein